MRRVFTYLLLLVLTYGADSHANPWVIGKREFYFNTSFFSLRSAHRFDLNSEKQLFSNDGSTNLYGVLINMNYGITNRLNINVAAPFLSYDFNDAINRITGNGFGDIQTTLKYKLYDRKFAASVQAGVKFPSPQYSGEFSDVRIGEGQYDYTALASIGYQPHKYLSYMSIDFGYRFRGENKDIVSNPGDEFIFRFDTGALLRSDILLSAGIDGFSSGKTEEFALIFNNTERRLVSASVNFVKGITVRTGLSLNMNIPIAGKNYNAGSTFGVGLFFYRGKYLNINRS